MDRTLRRVSLGGAVAVPGLQDAHGHLENLGAALGAAHPADVFEPLPRLEGSPDGLRAGRHSELPKVEALEADGGGEDAHQGDGAG